MRCVAVYCSNTSTDGVTLHEFQFIKDHNQLRAWINFVKTKRKYWDGPTKTSALCSDHFALDCYPFKVRFEIEQTGKRPKHARLNDGAVPTIHAQPPAQNVTDIGPGPGTRETGPPSRNVTDTGPGSGTCETDPSSSCRRKRLTTTESTSLQISPPKKLRKAYTKRETKMVKVYYDNYFTYCNMELIKNLSMLKRL